MNALLLTVSMARSTHPQARLAQGVRAWASLACAGLGWLLVAAWPAQAGTLAQAVELAWARHPQAAAHAARQAQAQAQGDLAAALTPAPAALSLSSRSDRFNANRGQQEWEAEVAVPLWLPGQRSARRLQARSAAAQVDARNRELHLQIAGELRQAWWQLAAARQAAALAATRVGTALALEADVRRRWQAGELARIDANRALGELLAAQTEEMELRSAQSTAEQAWQVLTGVAAPDALDEPRQPAALVVSDDHPQLAAAAANARALHDLLRVAETTRRDAPELALRVVRERGDFSERYANQIGIKLTIPFSSAPGVRQEVAAAQAELSQAETVVSTLRQRLQLDVERARDELAATERRLAMAQQGRVLAADTLQLAQKAFALGEVDLEALLRARAAAQEAEGGYSRMQLARGAAQSRLLQALGVLP